MINSYQRARINALTGIMRMIDRAENRGRACEIAAGRVGLSPDRLETLFYKWRREGQDALVDGRRVTKVSGIATVQLTTAERQVLVNAALRCDSAQLAIEEFAASPVCRPEIREIIQRFSASRNYPRFLLRAARATPEQRDLARGHKTFQLRAYTTLRSNTWIDSAGVEHPLTGGDLFECDDMSLNQPFWYEWPYGGDKLSDKFGVRLGRQMLACIDTATGKWLGFDLIGRVRDAYRAEDVVRFLGRIGETHGLPRLGFRLEQGVWASRSIRGVKGAKDEEEQQTFASVRDLVDIYYVHSPKAKGIIEGAFNLLQTILALSGIQIGRKRGEYERTTQMMLACAEGSKHPAHCGFPHISEIAERVDAAMARADARPKLGRLLRGIPQEKFSAAVAAEPLDKVPDDQRHLFLPIKQVRPIKAGFVHSLKVSHYGRFFSFAVPDFAAHLGADYRVLLCFDPADPHAGARVFDAETDGRRDCDNARGQFLGIFPFTREAPQLDFSGRRDSTTKRQYTAAARTHFRATGMTVGTGASVDQKADGRGDVTRIVTGIAPSSQPSTLSSQRADSALKARRDFAAGGEQKKRAVEFGRAIAREIHSPAPAPETPVEIEKW